MAKKVSKLKAILTFSILLFAPQLAVENLLTSTFAFAIMPISASKPTLVLKVPPVKTFLLLMPSLPAPKKGRGRLKKKYIKGRFIIVV